MNVKRHLKRLGCGLLALTLASLSWGYALIKDSHGYIVTWVPGSVPMQIKLATNPALSDGTSQAASVQAAMQAWNALLGTVQFTPQIVGPATYANGNGTSEIVMDSTMDGTAFGSNVLAVTLSYSSGNSRVESDIVFNTFYTWDSYRGNLRTPQDIRRVAIHELGHVLGLDHPDEAGQSVTAIMNSRESNIDTMQSDDIAGAQSLYGAPGFVPSNNNFANAININLGSGSVQVTGTNVAATSEAGEPNLDPDDPGHKTVWWKWTAPNNGSITVTTLGSNFDTLLGVYTGSAVNSLSQIALNDDVQSGVIRTSAVTFNPTSGTTYFIAVDGWGGYTGSITLNLNFVPVIPNVAPSITSQPSNRTVVAGQSAQFTVSATGTPSPTYQWQRLPAGSGTWSNLVNAGSYSGVTTNSLTVASTTLAVSGDQFRCVASNVAGSATSNAALLTVTAATPPSVIWPSLGQTISPTSGLLNISGFSVQGTGPFVYQWFKDGVAIPGSNNSFYSKSSVTIADAGVYSVLISNAAGLVMSPDIVVNWQNDPAANPWLDVFRLGNVVYFLTVPPGRIMRYDLVQEAWLPSVNLSTAPTAFLPTAEGIFIAYGPNLVRRSLDLQTETTVTSSSTAINCLFSFGSLIYYQEGTTVKSRNRVDLSAGPAFAPPGGTVQGGFTRRNRPVFSNTLSRGFTTHPSVSPDDIIQFTVAGNATFTSDVDSPYHGDLAIGTKQYLSPNEQLLIDNSGVVYSTADLAYVGAFGSSFDDLTFLDDGTPMVLRGNVLSARTQDSFIETSRVTLPIQSYNVFSQAGATFAFGAPATPAGNPTVIKVPAASFVPLAAPAPFAPLNTRFSIEDLFADNNGVIHLLSRSARGLIRWNTQGNAFLPTLPMRGGPAFFSYAPASNRYVLGYPDGSLTQFQLGTDTLERRFANYSSGNPVLSMISADDLLVLNLKSAGTTGTGRLVVGPGGDRRFLTLGSFYGAGLAWQSSNRRLYSYSSFSTNIVYETVPATGILPGQLGSFGNVTPPLRFNADGSAVLSSNGRVFNADLTQVGTLANAVTDAVWLSDGLNTIRAGIGGTELQKWTNTTYALSASKAITGLPLRIFRASNTSVVVVTLVDGYVSFTLVSSDFSMVSSAVNNGSIVPWVAPVITTQPHAATLTTGAPVTLTAAATGNPAPTFQWQRNGVAIPGATASSYSVASAGPGTVGVYTVVATNFAGSVTSASALLSFGDAANTDFNGDAQTDIIWQNKVTGQRALWLMNGLTGGFTPRSIVNLGWVDTNWEIAATADFNADGQPDILWQNVATGQRALWLMNGIGGGFIPASIVNLGWVDTAWEIAGVGDFNSDGQPDIIWQNTVTGQRALWLMNGIGGGFTPVSIVNLGWVDFNWQIAATGDFNNDGQLDVLWQNTATGQRALWLMNGLLGGFTPASIVDLGWVDTAWDIAATSDFNSDGQTDILWQNVITGQRALWLMNGIGGGFTPASIVNLGWVDTNWEIAY